MASSPRCVLAPPDEAGLPVDSENRLTSGGIEDACADPGGLSLYPSPVRFAPAQRMRGGADRKRLVKAEFFSQMTDETNGEPAIVGSEHSRQSVPTRG